MWKYFEKIGFKYSDNYLKFYEKGKVIGYIARNTHQSQIESYLNKIKEKKENHKAINLNPITFIPTSSSMKINSEVLLESSILFLYIQDNLKYFLCKNENIDFKTFKNIVISKLGSNIKLCKSYQKIFEELLSKLDPNSVQQKNDFYNPSSKFNEKKAVEDFMNRHNNGGIFQKFFFIPKETTIFCNKCKMKTFECLYDKFILIKDAQNLVLSQKLFQPEVQNNQEVMCSFCNWAITSCSIETKILDFPKVLIVIIEPSQINNFQISSNFVFNDGKTKEYKLSQFIENNTNFFYIINTSNNNICHKYNDKNQFGNGEQVLTKKPIVLFYNLIQNNIINMNLNISNSNNINQNIFNQNANCTQMIAQNNQNFNQQQLFQNNQQNMNFINQNPQQNMQNINFQNINLQNLNQINFNPQNNFGNENIQNQFNKNNFFNNNMNNNFQNNFINNNFNNNMNMNIDNISNMNNIIISQRDEINSLKNELITLKNQLKNKNDEVEVLKLKIDNLINKNTVLVDYNKIRIVQFRTIDQSLICSIKCLPTDTFAEVEEKLYQKYPQYRETNNAFHVDGKSILRFKTISENNIQDDHPVQLTQIQ